MELENINESIIPIDHCIVDGIYNRTAYAKAGNIIVGCSHLKDGIAFLLSGTILQIDGDKKYKISAPKTIQTKKGTQRIAYAVTDCTYSTVHRVKATTVEDAEREVFKEVPQITRIRNDFNKMLLDFKIDAKMIEKEMTSKGHKLELSDIYKIDLSPIDGYGIFAKKNILKDELIAVSQSGNIRYSTARYINHSDNPNSMIKKQNNDIILIAIKDIQKGSEIFTNYKESLKCQQ